MPAPTVQLITVQLTLPGELHRQPADLVNLLRELETRYGLPTGNRVLGHAIPYVAYTYRTAPAAAPHTLITLYLRRTPEQVADPADAELFDLALEQFRCYAEHDELRTFLHEVDVLAEHTPDDAALLRSVPGTWWWEDCAFTAAGRFTGDTVDTMEATG